MKTVYWTISIAITIQIVLEIVQRRELDYSCLVAIAVNFWGYQIWNQVKKSQTVTITKKSWQDVAKNISW